MKEHDIKKYWNNNAQAWTELSRQGYDLYRDHIGTPAFLNMLPPVTNMVGLDVGCGEGHNTQLVAERGAVITGIDISDTFIAHAKGRESKNKSLKFMVASACDIPFGADYFDFCVSTMVFMDFPDQEKALREIYRVLKPGGFFQFSIMHPFYDRIDSEWVYENGEIKGYLIKNYFQNPQGEIDEWMFSAVPPESKPKYNRFKIPRFNKRISEWINILVNTGFSIEEIAEPFPDSSTVKKYPKLKDATLMPYFLIIRVTK
ncbi:MAG: class I SAM-dependent methyltransferase [Spirochaetales bacterium]|nr:class I SAM-dependent methyltransferase [Spirochaetales bacterium]